MEVGETVEMAIRREVKEETNLDLSDLRLFGVYSDPGRDPRRHTISIVFTGRGHGVPRAGDDAGRIVVVPPRSIDFPLAFDHERILRDYLQAGNQKIR